MSFDADLTACAQLVERGDPDRFAATMAAPVEARKILFPIYAFNIEVARAPWVTQEPLIAEMRLQWWQDALDEIAAGGVVRRHEVVTPLSKVLTPETAALLTRNVDARRRDAQRLPMETLDELTTFLSETAGTLMWAVTRALAPTADWEPVAETGPSDLASWQTKVRDRSMAVGSALGLANYLLAVPVFLQRSMNPLPGMTESAFADLLDRNLSKADAKGTPLQAPVKQAQRIAELSAWRTKPILERAKRDPAAVPEGRLEGTPAERSFRLMWQSVKLRF